MAENYFHTMPFGAEVLPDGRVRFQLWAPSQAAVALVVEDEQRVLPMAPLEDGFFGLTTDAARVGSRYRFELDDGLRVPDPASRWQPDDVHGPSVVVDPRAYAWRHTAWRGRPWAEAVLYELHVGAFTEEGTFDGVRRKLDHLAELGVTAIELMPLAEFSGTRNWGYDGVMPFAPDAAYGSPDDLKRLIDEAHARGLMMFLDVVYNHFGPEGNYLPRYAKRLLRAGRAHALGRGDQLQGTGGARVRAPQRAVLARGVPLRRPALRRRRPDHRPRRGAHPEGDRGHGQAHAPRRAARPSGARERQQPGASARARCRAERRSTTMRSGTTTSTTSIITC